MANTTAQQVADALESIAPKSLGNANDELGFMFGDSQKIIRGVACMWNAHSSSIARAAQAGLDMILTHEVVFFQPQPSSWFETPQSLDQIDTNHKRRFLLERSGMVVYRAHSNWDALPADGVPDQAVGALGIDGLKVVAAQKYFKVHQLPRPMSVSELANQARVGLGMPWPPRIFGDARRRIERFIFFIGGFGTGFNLPQIAHRMGAQAMIIGEMLEWTLIHALELDIPVIETLHSLSEIPAIKRQAQILQQRLPDIPVRYIGSGSTDF
jgi:putative NIF3 family GTP cyclohydrolase 1 type 2